MRLFYCRGISAAFLLISGYCVIEMRRFSNGHSLFIPLLSCNTNIPAPTLFSRRGPIIISLPIKFCLQILRTLFWGENQIFTQLHIRKHNKNYQPLITSRHFLSHLLHDRKSSTVPTKRVLNLLTDLKKSKVNRSLTLNRPR